MALFGLQSLQALAGKLREDEQRSGQRLSARGAKPFALAGAAITGPSPRTTPRPAGLPSRRTTPRSTDAVGAKVVDGLRTIDISRVAAKTAALGANVGDGLHTIDIWTFNLRHEGMDAVDGHNGWSQRREGVADFIGARRPLVVCVQEATANMMAFLTARLGESEYGWIGTSCSLKPNDEMAGFLFDRRLIDLVVHQTIWLGPDGVARGKPCWDADYPRTLEIAVFRAFAPGKTVGSRGRELGLLRVLNTHFDHVGVVARRKSAEFIASILASGAMEWPDCVQILTGDFNSPKGNNDVYDILSQGIHCPALRDVGRQVPMEGDVSFTIHKWHGTNFKAKHGDGTVDLSKAASGNQHPDAQHIDWVFWKNGNGLQLKPIKYVVMTDRIPTGQYLSDHFPISASFSVEQPENFATSGWDDSPLIGG